MSLRHKTEQIIRNSLSDLKTTTSRLYCTSSFQTQSVPLLHIVGEAFPEINVIFLDTGFLFPETYQFKNDLERLLNIDIITLRSEIPYLAQRHDMGLFNYSIDPDFCCEMNKVNPLEKHLQEGDILISGIRKDQSLNRSLKKEVENTKQGYLKVHPMLDWTSRDVYKYIKDNNLPSHPLEKEGYISIGCVPCTTKWNSGDAREGRWQGSKKTECGLHINTKN